MPNKNRLARSLHINSEDLYVKDYDIILKEDSAKLTGDSVIKTVNFVSRAADNALNCLNSEFDYLKILFDNEIDNLVIFFMNEDSADTKFREFLTPNLSRSIRVSYSTYINRLKVNSCEVYNLKETEDVVYRSTHGWICKREVFSRISKILENLKLTPSEYNQDAFSKVFWTEKTVSLKNDISFFASSKDWFDKRDLPYARSYLLYGPPGNGKTSAIRAISRFFNTNPETFSFTAKWDDPDSAFTSWIAGNKNDYVEDELEDIHRLSKIDSLFSMNKVDNRENPLIRVLLLEDLDRFFSKDFNPPVSISTILNALDGVVQRTNSVVIATANNPEKLDSQVFFRPGRFDLRIPFDSPNESMTIDYLKNLSSDDEISEAAITRIASACKGHSFAFLKGMYLAAANKAFSRSSKIISDEDLEQSAKEFISNLGKDIKSTKSGAGFQ